jgi:two-component system, NarL family, sensor kinase
VQVSGLLIAYQGQTTATLATFVDITERKNAMINLEQAVREKERLLVELEQQKNAVLRSFIRGQEDERHRIAQELHDGVGHLLSIVKIGLSSFQEHVQELVPHRLEEFQRFLGLYDQAVQEVRAVSHQLMPATLRKMGLKAALQDLATMLALSTKLRTHVSLGALETLPDHLSSELETSIFRIVQELVNNTIKYAKATTISIQMISGEGRLICVYEDDGVGFDTAHPSGGIGLQNITNRVMLLGGTVEFDSSPGNGVVVTMEIPVSSPARLSDNLLANSPDEPPVPEKTL